MTPFTTHEDRIKLWMLSAIIGAVILLTFSIAAPAQEYARQDDDRERDALAYVPKAVRGSRPAGCPSQWCGCWLKRHLSISDPAQRLNLARNWPKDKRFKRVHVPAPGAIAVFARGRKGGHVGIIKQVTGPNKIVLLSGNDGGAVRERERSTAGIIAYLRYEG